jgi:hypothetical protein
MTFGITTGGQKTENNTPISKNLPLITIKKLPLYYGWFFNFDFKNYFFGIGDSWLFLTYNFLG